MKRDWLEKLLGESATPELIDSIMGENGKDVNSAKGGRDALQETIDRLTAENDELTKARDANLTDAEKWQKQVDEANGRATKAIRALNETSAIAVFAKAGIAEDEYAPLLASIVTDDRKATVAAAQAIADIVSAKVEHAVKQAGKDALGSMRPPEGGDPSTGTVSTKAEFAKLPYSKQYELKQQDPEILSKLS